MFISSFNLALIQAVFHVGNHFWVRENWQPKIKKQFFFQGKFYLLKAHAHYFTVLIYLATWRAAKLDIFTHFTFTNLPRCSQNINSLIYVYFMQIRSCFLWLLDQLWSYFFILLPPKKFSVLPLSTQPTFFALNT